MVSLISEISSTDSLGQEKAIENIFLLVLGSRMFSHSLDLSRPRKPVVNFGWIGATTAFGYRFIDPIGVEFPCVISAAL